MKIVLSRNRGMFDLSIEILEKLADLEIKNTNLVKHYYQLIDKNHNLFVQVKKENDSPHDEIVLLDKSIDKDKIELSYTEFQNLPKINIDNYHYSCFNMRTNDHFISVIEKVGKERSKLEVVEIPDNCNWVIAEHNGYETLIYSKNIKL